MSPKSKKPPVAQQLIDSLLDELPLLSKKKSAQAPPSANLGATRILPGQREIAFNPNIKVDNSIVTEGGHEIKIREDSVIVKSTRINVPAPSEGGKTTVKGPPLPYKKTVIIPAKDATKVAPKDAILGEFRGDKKDNEPPDMENSVIFNGELAAVGEGLEPDVEPRENTDSFGPRGTLLDGAPHKPLSEPNNANNAAGTSIRESTFDLVRQNVDQVEQEELAQLERRPNTFAIAELQRLQAERDEYTDSQATEDIRPHLDAALTPQNGDDVREFSYDEIQAEELALAEAKVADAAFSPEQGIPSSGVNEQVEGLAEASRVKAEADAQALAHAEAREQSAIAKAARKQANREQQAKAQAAKELAAREQAARDEAARERAALEEARDLALKEKIAREQAELQAKAAAQSLEKEQAEASALAAKLRAQQLSHDYVEDKPAVQLTTVEPSLPIYTLSLSGPKTLVPFLADPQADATQENKMAPEPTLHLEGSLSVATDAKLFLDPGPDPVPNQNQHSDTKVGPKLELVSSAGWKLEPNSQVAISGHSDLRLERTLESKPPEPRKPAAPQASELDDEHTIPLIRAQLKKVEDLLSEEEKAPDTALESDGSRSQQGRPAQEDQLETIDRLMATEIRSTGPRMGGSGGQGQKSSGQKTAQAKSPVTEVRGKSSMPIFSSAEASLKQSESLRIAQFRISELEHELDRVRRENEKLTSAGETLRRHSDEIRSRAENVEQEKRESERILEEEKRVMRGQLNQKDRETAELRQRLEEAEGRLESNFKKIRVRERELEHRLEIVKMETATLVSTKDKMILDLKRQVDQLTHEAEYGKQKAQEMFNQYKEKQDTIRRVVRALRIALTILEGDEENVVPIKKAE